MNFEGLKKELKGTLHEGEAIRRIYATDASAYREMPQAVAIPMGDEDLKKLIQFARENQTSLIPRTAGTSLAGQVVGGGIVVDVSKHFTKILEINIEEEYAWVQPGIVRDELNRTLAEHGYFFAPETSTANRAMIGGMIGNNSCGSNSVVYGSTREHLLEVKALLSDGSSVHFKESEDLRGSADLENELYQNISEILLDEANVNRIKKEFPKPDIPRRNTGYALDLLANMQPFNPKGKPFNFCSLIAGSEGTLAFVTAAKLKITKIPQGHKRLVCIHCKSIEDSLKANLIALNYQPYACELMDHYILEATARNKEQAANRFFVEGEPKAILVVELIGETEKEVDIRILNFLTELGKQRLGYAFPIIKGDDITKVWNLRKAGLGLLSNIPGDTKPAPVIEDTAVDVMDLPNYIGDFNKILHKHGLYSVHYAHAGSGELHLRPYLNLKTEEGVKLFRTIAEEIANLVKKYKGSLSGEHGDGRLRGEFIPKMIGEENYQLLKKVKHAWDPENIFNPGKIVDTAPMDTSLRFDKNHVTPEYDTMLDFSKDQGIVRSTELCNGSGDCRKSELTGGTMCPSYQATRDEKDTTRARANILREMLTRSKETNPFAQPEIKEVMDLCLSCKGCKSECPSNVDMGKLKAEWQYQSMKESGASFRTKMIANYAKSMEWFEKAPWVFNLTRNVSKPVLGFAGKRSIPKMANQTLRYWFEKKFHSLQRKPKKTVYFFFDEFTNYLDVEIGKKAIMLLDRMGYEVRSAKHAISGRTYLSKGMLEETKELASENVNLFHGLLKKDICLVGIEPSAILTFRDEYPDLLRDEEKKMAEKVAEKTFTIEEFLAKELDAGNLTSSDFPRKKQKVLVHGHCHQKALSSMIPTMKILKAAEGFDVQMIPSGCCGMAGSFGYEKEHFEVSMKIGELVLFPKVRESEKDTIILASGTSCRHQILDGTGKVARHIVEIL
ncbi:FAD-binding and (Fe-S)-binding domain-containing protein [Ekhidna sp.]|uniref:FAD-binding and (Fe-S)-binding domain-containing protein n=1 Tax=Ekhidna sp. TaxID=2608089 RepID=UPI003B5C9D28